MKKFNTFREFYPFYLSQHANKTCRNLHIVGSLSGLALALYALLSGHIWLVLCAPILGYAFSWTGHFVFEKNKPATFGHPLYSFLGDWVMLGQFLTRRLGNKLSGSRARLGASNELK